MFDLMPMKEEHMRLIKLSFCFSYIGLYKKQNCKIKIRLEKISIKRSSMYHCRLNAALNIIDLLNYIVFVSINQSLLSQSLDQRRSKGRKAGKSLCFLALTL